MNLNVTASLIKNKRTTLERIEKWISGTYFTEVNLYGKLYPYRKDAVAISHWQIPGGDGKWEEWNIDLILNQINNFSPVQIGDVFGPSWTTHWFLIKIEIPNGWDGKEVRLRWKSQSEAMIWDLKGRPLQGLSSGTSHQLRTDFCISKCWDPTKDKKDQSFLVEMVASRMFGVGFQGLINPPKENEKFTLEMVEVCVFDTTVYSLLIDLQVLHDLAKHLSEDQRGYRALYVANQMINDLIAGNMSQAQEIAKDFFSKGNGDMALTLALIGNCHIDSAWLWPYSETKRKCARSWSSTIALMQDYPEMVFAASQAQQFEWVKETYPDLYGRIKEKFEAGKFLHVGATWVEMDGQLPSGESFMRQFLYGQRFFENEFGSRSTIFWLPDTFGYSAQIPQICKHFDVSYFLTQKLSWNLVNKFPHHTFIWEGIDGSSILAHFPPGDSYEMNVKVEEVLKTERNLNDKGRVSIAGFMYGYGDGGGGPTQDMLERARRLSDLDGCPRMKHMTPVEMFEWMASERRNLCRWVGELYLELHNGTYTSQATTKFYNRKCEFELRKSEFLLTFITALKKASEYEIKREREKCEHAWKKLLLNQFHDVLPGTSIAIVYRDSEKLYKEALCIARDVAKFCIWMLSEGCPEINETLCVINSFPWPVAAICTIDGSWKIGEPSNKYVQVSSDNSSRYIAIEVPPLTCTSLSRDPPLPNSVSPISREARILSPPPVIVEGSTSNGFDLQNQFIQASFNSYGQLLSLKDLKNHSKDIFMSSRDLNLSPYRGNLICLYDDVPLFWDAWDVMDYHLETRQVLNSETNDKCVLLRIVQSGPLRAELQIEIPFGKESSISQKIILTAVDPFITFENQVEWKEAHKILKVEFNTNLNARKATYDIQFGHIDRPTHKNTSWDSAMFEVCGHKWANIAEYDCGLSLLNDCKYGWSSDQGKLALSLLRAPKSPDPNCDMGKHTFKYAAMPHRGNLQTSRTLEAAYEFNSPCSIFEEKFALQKTTNWLQIIGDGVMIEALKVAETSHRAIVIRLFEMFGGARTIGLEVYFPIVEVWACNGMEEPFALLHINTSIRNEEIGSISCSVQLHFHPFQIQTIQLILK